MSLKLHLTPMLVKKSNSSSHILCRRTDSARLLSKLHRCGWWEAEWTEQLRAGFLESRAWFAKNTPRTVHAGLGSHLSVSASSVIDPLEGERLLLLLTFDLGEADECFMGFCLNTRRPLLHSTTFVTLAEARLPKPRVEVRFRKGWIVTNDAARSRPVSTNQSSATYHPTLNLQWQTLIQFVFQSITGSVAS